MTLTNVSIRPTAAASAGFSRSAIASLDLAEAREIWAHTRARHGFRELYAPLIQPGEGNAKLAKNVTPTFGLTIAPHRLAGVGNACKCSTIDCRALCLFSSGKGGLADVYRARVARAVMLAEHPRHARRLMMDEIERALNKFGRRHIAFRPNVTSDLPYHLEPWLNEMPRRLQLYGYTKHRDYLRESGRYDFTFSVSEREKSLADVAPVLEGGHRVAVVVPIGEPLPASIAGWPVIDGDATDARWRDPVGIVTLRAKGAARNVPASVDRFVKPFAEWCSA